MRRFELPSALPLVVALAASASCTVDQRAFDERVFTCNPAASDPRCGKTEGGAEMTCFPGSQLDGTDFCAPKCGDASDPSMSELPTGSAVCTSNNAVLKTCNPTNTAAAGGPCGQGDFACLRTDILSDAGICVDMHPCQQDTDCPSPVRSTCAATFLRELYQGEPNLVPDLHLDNLYCLQRGCLANHASCGPGQTCLPAVLPAGSGAPDICVPDCDSNDRCPPNHFCFRKLSGAANPPVCIPGLLGFECETDVDCLMGTCTELADGPINPKLCSIECQSDDDCARYDSAQGNFLCAPQQDGLKHCVTPFAYRGATCHQQSDCTRNPGTFCAHLTSDGDGTCIFPCPPDGACPAYSGIPHTCLPLPSPQVPVCFPGMFHLYCTNDTQCVGGLSCRAPTGSAAPPFCTAVCQTDDDCARNRWIGPGAVCTGSVCSVPPPSAGASP